MVFLSLFGILLMTSSPKFWMCALALTSMGLMGPAIGCAFADDAPDQKAHAHHMKSEAMSPDAPEAHSHADAHAHVHESMAGIKRSTAIYTPPAIILVRD